MALSGLVAAGVDQALQDVLDRRLKEAVRQQQERQAQARLALDRDVLSSANADREAGRELQRGQQALQSRQIDLADLKRIADETAEKTQAAGRSDMASVLAMPGMSNEAKQQEMIGSGLRTGTVDPARIIEGLTRIPPRVPLHQVTVPGPQGQPIAKGVTDDVLAGGVELYRAPVSAGVGTVSQEDVDDTAQQLVDGNLVPAMLSRRGNYNQLLAAANRLSKEQLGKPYNAARAQTEFAGAQRFMSSLNGPQQVRFRGLAQSVVNTIDEVRVLADEMKNSGLTYANRAEMEVALRVLGNSERGQLVAKYLGATNTLKEEFANLVNGGYAPTEAAFNLANKQINENYGVKAMNASLSEVQRLINFRLQAFDTLTPTGVTPDNPAIGGLATPKPVSSPKPPSGTVMRIPKG